jgi:hypothetical protein
MAPPIKQSAWAFLIAGARIFYTVKRILTSTRCEVPRGDLPEMHQNEYEGCTVVTGQKAYIFFPGAIMIWNVVNHRTRMLSLSLSFYAILSASLSLSLCRVCSSCSHRVRSFWSKGDAAGRRLDSRCCKEKKLQAAIAKSKLSVCRKLSFFLSRTVSGGSNSTGFICARQLYPFITSKFRDFGGELNFQKSKQRG